MTGWRVSRVVVVTPVIELTVMERSELVDAGDGDTTDFVKQSEEQDEKTLDSKGRSDAKLHNRTWVPEALNNLLLAFSLFNVALAAASRIHAGNCWDAWNPSDLVILANHVNLGKASSNVYDNIG